MADTRDNATNELFYITDSPPVGEAALRLPTNYTKLGLAVSETISQSRNMIPANDKDSGDGETSIPGRSSGNASVNGNRPKDGNAGQILVELAYDNKTLLNWLLSDNMIGDRAMHGTAYCENYEWGSDDQTVRTFSLTLNIQGLPTKFVIAT
jgi:hypothetical protein